jgi:hypothetical protein
VIEDRGFERSQVRTWLEAQLVHKMLSRPPIDLERFRLSARTVERDHQLPTQPLPITVLIDQRLELSNELRMTPSGQIRLDPRLNAAKAKLLQSGRLCLSERLVHDIGEGGPAPQRQRTAQ